MPDRLPTRVVIIALGVLLIAVLGPLLAPRSPSEVLDPVAGRLLPPLAQHEVVHRSDGRRWLGEIVERREGSLRMIRLGAEVSILEEEVNETGSLPKSSMDSSAPMVPGDLLSSSRISAILPS